MRSTSVKVSVSTAIVVVLLSAVPAEAANRTAPRGREQSQRVVQLIRQAIARSFGVIAQALPTIPIPGAPKEEETSQRTAPLLPASGETDGSGTSS